MSVYPLANRNATSRNNYGKAWNRLTQMHFLFPPGTERNKKETRKKSICWDDFKEADLITNGVGANVFTKSRISSLHKGEVRNGNWIFPIWYTLEHNQCFLLKRNELIDSVRCNKHINVLRAKNVLSLKSANASVY